MENNEVMNYGETMEMDPEVETFETDAEESEMGTGVAMLIGAGLAFATTAIVKLGKKAYATYKTKKGLRKSTEEETEDETESADKE